MTTTATAHEVTIVEHGARAGTLYARCPCGWHAGPHRWETIRRKADAHKETGR